MELNENVPDQLNCIICNSILKNAQQTPCGCRMCYKCINFYLSDGSKPCPGREWDCVHQLTMNDVKQDMAINNKIGRLMAKCPLCSNNYSIMNMKSHIRNCELREIDCNECKETIIFKMKKHHNDKLCKSTLVICKYCKGTTRFNEFSIRHLNSDIDISSESPTSQMHLLLQIFGAAFPNLPDGLRCTICCSILKNARQSSCGCRFCEKCIKGYLSSGPKFCPGNESNCIDQLTLNDLYPDYAANKDIGHLQVKCPFKRCSFEGFLVDTVNHAYNCQYQYIKCQKCQRRVSIYMRGSF